MNFIKPSFLNSNQMPKKELRSDEEIESELVKVGKILKESRRRYNLSRKDLADKTRISAPVIEAIEEGWEAKLPEKAYLIKMLRILEEQLGLKKGELQVLIDDKEKSNGNKSFWTFVPQKIDIFSTRQGSLVYISIMLFSLFLVNYTQNKYHYKNHRTFSPLRLNPKQEAAPEIKEQQSNSYKDPANFLEYIFLAIKESSSKIEHGSLEISLSRESNIQIINKAKENSYLENISGELKLNLISPEKIIIEPPLKSTDLILWNGNRVLVDNNKKGIYVIK